jgi:hypothetical protein
MKFDVTWGRFKALHAHKGLAKSRVQFICVEGHHEVAFADGPFIFYSKLVGGSADALEFEAGWMSEANGAAC